MNLATQQASNRATLRGWVNTYYRHYKGKKLGPYYVRRWKVGRKVHREYIKSADVERVKAACQAHRESRRGVYRFLDNFDFLAKIVKRYDHGKVVTAAMEAYILRIHREGMYITGRPPMRRRITRTIALVGGEEFLVKTVFELDGTTKVFMVPFSANSPKFGPERRFVRLADVVTGAFDSFRASPFLSTPHFYEGANGNWAT